MTRRTLTLINSIKFSFLAKFLSILVSLIVTPMLFKILGEHNYGLWATILPIFTWLTFFDLGIGNGLRNKITKYIVDGDFDIIRLLIGNALIMSLIIVLVISSTLIIMTFWGWRSGWLYFFEENATLYRSVQIVIIGALVSFVLNLVNNLYHSIQRSQFVTYGQLLTNSLVFILIIPYWFGGGHSDLVDIALIYSISIVISGLLLAWLFFYNNKRLLPKIIDLNIKKEYSSLKAGSAFLILQLASLIIFFSDRLIITTFVDASETAQYDIIYKYFSLVVFMQSIFTTPAWSATADALASGDCNWVRRAIKIQHYLFFVLVFIVSMMLLSSGFIFSIWMGESFVTRYSILIAMALFLIVMSWNNIYSTILSGANVLRFQVLSASVSAILNIPLSIVFIKYFHHGAESVLMSSILCLLFFSVCSPFVLKRKLYEVENQCS